jgi:hypothetical protein
MGERKDRTMRRYLAVLAAVPVALIAIGSVQLFAGQGPNGMACVGDPWEVEGWVESIQSGPGSGLVIDTGTETVFVFGLAPVWYWSENNVTRPEIGDYVSLVVSDVKCMDEPVLISITTDEYELDLRNDACYPLWHGATLK